MPNPGQVTEVSGLSLSHQVFCSVKRSVCDCKHTNQISREAVRYQLSSGTEWFYKETKRVRSLVCGGRCPSCTSSRPCPLLTCSLTLKAEHSPSWLLPCDPLWLHMWYRHDLSATVPPTGQTQSVLHICRWLEPWHQEVCCSWVLHVRKLAGKDSAAASHGSTGP